MSVTEDPPFDAATATGAELAKLASFAGIPATQQNTLDPNEYDFFQAVAYKMNGGLRGMIDLIIYSGCVGGFISLQVSNGAIYTNIGKESSGLIVPFDDKITDYNKTMSYIVMIGILLSLIRITFADKFIKEAKLNRIFEIIWGLVVWGLFVLALIITWIIRGQLKDALARADNSSVEKQTSIKLAQKQADSQVLIMGLAVGATTLLTAYNIYDFFTPEELKIGAGLTPAAPTS